MYKWTVVPGLLAAIVGVSGVYADPAVTDTSAAGVGRSRLVLLISLDGARPDGIEQADTPHMDALVAAGAEAADAQSCHPFLTLPSHIAMLTGLRSSNHGVMLNGYVDPMPPMPAASVFDICDRHGLTSLMLAGKPKMCMIRPLGGPPKISRIVPLSELGTSLVEATRSVTPQFIFLHSAHPDLDGHAYGWMSPPYLEAIERCDRMIGEVVAWVRESGLWDRTLIIVTADHGGFAKTHRGEHPADIAIPWIVSGGLAAGAEMPPRVMIYDAAPTILRTLGLPIPEGIDGRAVEGIKAYPDVAR